MEQLISAFGIDGRLIVIQIFNFAVLAGLLWYFLYKPVLRLIDERQKKIKQGVADAEAAEAAKRAAEEKRAEVLTTAHEEAESIVARAEAHAREQEAAHTEKAQEKANAIIENAHTTSKELKETARRESEAEIAKLAVLAAEKVLRERSQ